HPAIAEQQGRAMPRTTKLDPAGSSGSSAHERGKIRRESRFAENATSPLHQLFHRQSAERQRPENSVQVRHQHRRRYAFTRSITDQEKQTRRSSLANNQITVVAAHRTLRLVMVGDLPAPEGEIRFRQEPALHLGSKL